MKSKSFLSESSTHEKYVVPYDEFKSICLEIARRVHEDRGPIFKVICIARGGMTAGHIIAKALGVPVAFVSLTEIQVQSVGVANTGHTYLVVDDMTDRGRTMMKTQIYLENLGPDNIYLYSAVFQVGAGAVDYVGRVETSRWLVMPNEDQDAVVVGDKGLFSNGQSKYKSSLKA